MAATQYAADTPLLVAGLIATSGVFSLWRLWIYGIAFFVLGYILGPCWRRAGVLTDAELVELRYSGRGVAALRVLKALYFGTLINCTVLAMVLAAATRIAEAFLPWHVWLPGLLYDPWRVAITRAGFEIASGVSGLDPATATANNVLSLALILLFVTLYSTTGGLRSVVATDVVQFATAMIATAIYAAVIVAKAGGWGSLVTRLVHLYGEPRTADLLALTPPSEVLGPFLLLIALQWLFQMNSDGSGYLAQRAMGCRSDHDTVVAGLVFSWAQIVVRSLLWLPIGVALLVVYPMEPSAVTDELAAAREYTFVAGVRDTLPLGIRGLMLTGLLAALASTVDTHLNWGASYWANDLYLGIVQRRWLRREPHPRELVWVARLSNLVIVATALAIMVQLGSIQTAWRLSLLFGAGIGSVLLLRWFWERINLAAEVAAVAASMVTAPVVIFWAEPNFGLSDGGKLAAMALISTGIIVLVALWSTPTNPDVLLRFYQRVHPPGWWPRTAHAAGEPRSAPVKRLLHGLRAVAASSVALYLALGGGVRLLLPPPGAPRWPGMIALAGSAAIVFFGRRWVAVMLRDVRD